jgi:hypothetical protein
MASAIWIWVQRIVVDYVEQKDADRKDQAARAAIDIALNNPHITTDQRDEYLEQLAALNDAHVQRKVARALEYAPKK